MDSDIFLVACECIVGYNMLWGKQCEIFFNHSTVFMSSSSPLFILCAVCIRFIFFCLFIIRVILFFILILFVILILLKHCTTHTPLPLQV